MRNIVKNICWVLVLGTFLTLSSSQVIAANTRELITQLASPSLEQSTKWKLSQQIVAQGMTAIPILSNYLQDTRKVGIQYPRGGECINRPAHQPPPKHCQNLEQVETLGMRSELLLYQIVTPIYTSPYTTRVSAKVHLGRPFIIEDWKKWWQQHNKLSLIQIHEQARKLIDEFWLRGYQEGSVKWKN